MSTTEDKTETDQEKLARETLQAAVARGLAQWRVKRLGAPEQFIVDELLKDSYLVEGGTVRLVAQVDGPLAESDQESDAWTVYTEPDSDKIDG
jgi:hypothetical protein